VVVFNRPIQKLFKIRMMRGQLITGLESQRDVRTEAVMVSPAFPTPVLKKLLDVALMMFENVR
jgi:hypothetical protein